MAESELNTPVERPGPVGDGGEALSEGLLSAFLDLLPDAGLVVDEHGVIVSTNEQAEVLFGYPEGSLAGVTVEDLVPEGVRHLHRGHRAGYLSSPARRPMGVGLELVGRRRDGDEFPVDISLAPIAVSDRSFVVAAVRDVTEQRAATAAQSELAAIVRSSLDAIISTTLEGLVTSWNPGAKDLLGYEPEDILGRHVSTIVPDGASAALEELLDSAVQGRRREAVDTQWRRKDGSDVDVAVSVSPLHDRGGHLLGFSLLARDISERKRAEAELRRLLAEEARLERQHAATAEIRLSLLSGSRLDEALMLICERAAELTDSRVAALCIRGDDGVVVAAAFGPAVEMVGDFLPAGSFTEKVIETAEPLRITHRSDQSNVDVPRDLPDGPTLGAPVLAGGVANAALTLVRDVGQPEYSGVDLVVTEALASQAALALQLEQARADREEVMLAGDRERIARDLHDLVIQQLFATGMTLQSALTFIDRPTARERVEGAVEALDDTIREVRNTIYGLSRPLHAERQLRAQVLDLAERAVAQLGFEPSVHFDGPVDSRVPEDTVPHVLAVLREALSNAARHARARSVRVDVVVDGDEVMVAVEDDGVGIGQTDRLSGLANLEERARLVGGSFSCSAPAGGGTRVEWRTHLD